MVTIVSSSEPWLRPKDELRQNFISDEMKLHTSKRPELNLIKSDIYKYIAITYIFYPFNHILL